MRKYYKDLINKVNTELRNALLTAISHLIGEDEKCAENMNFWADENVHFCGMSPVFYDRGFVNTKETTVQFEYEEEGVIYKKDLSLDSCSNARLQAIYDYLEKYCG